MKYPMHILLVDDNEGDVELTRIAFEENDLPAMVTVAHDGAEALDYLFCHQEGESAPDLILLDLNMPRVNGREFLDAIKQDAQMQRIPVVILTGCKASSDIMESYKRDANCYVLKPSSLDAYIAMAKKIEEFWTKTVQLPRKA